MDGMNQRSPSRGYFSILLEEIALEGLDGITLDVLWIRLKNNPEWCLKPIDHNIQEFIWRKLKTLEDVRWYNIKQPRKTPPIFKYFDEFVAAAEKGDIQITTYSSACYPHHLIRDGDIVGSCATYEERIDVTSEVQKMDLTEANERYPYQLVIVANQDVRNHFLLTSSLNPEADVADISYCILERIGRARRCGEVSCGIQFLRNGANPTFYFWNKLRKLGLVTSQTTNFSSRLSNNTLFHLPKYHRSYVSETTNAVYRVVNAIKSSPNKCLPVLDVKAMFPNEGRKATKSDLFRRFLKIETIPYKECYPDSSDSDCITKSGGVKVVRVVKLKDESIDPQSVLYPSEPDNENEMKGILEGARLANRPLAVQCYKYFHERGVEGTTLMEIGAVLGLNKLNSRLLVNTLKKLDFVTRLYFDNGRQRYYRYYLKELEMQVGDRLKNQLGDSFTMSNENSPEKNTASNEISITKAVEKASEVEKKSKKVNDAEDSNAMEVPEASAKSNAMEVPGASAKRKASEEAGESSNPKRKRGPASHNASETSKNNPKKPSVKRLSIEGNVCWLRRTNIILEYLYKHQVTTRSDILRLIKEEETKLGVSTGTPCAKSIKKIVSMLNHKNKLKEIHKVIVEERLNKKREVFFVCAPNVTEDHPIIQTHLTNIKKNLSIIHLKSSVVCSEKKLQEIRSKFSRQFRCKENDSKYGMAPKFARMRILHEFLISLVYHYEGDENLNPEDCNNYIKSFCSDFDEGEEIPKVYFKEISSRMFIPPLTKYEEYSDGWTSVNDIAERIPLKMMFSLVRFSYLVPGIDAYLKHPVKQFYLLRHLPYDIQQILTADKKYISSIYADLKNLCLIGLAQLGPRIEGRGSLNLVYMNKKTELVDTRPCPPTYFQIYPQLNYMKYDYDFVESKNTEEYWNDAFRFCVATRLCRKLSATNLAVKGRKMKPELLIYLSEHPINEASRYDTGKIPGDGLGAAGYDSSLFSHFFKQWFPTNNEKVTPAPTISKVVPKQMRLKNNTQLKRMRVTFSKRRHKKKCVAESYDKTDLEALEKMKTLRATWSKNEDEILTMCYIACQYYKPRSITYSLGPVYRRLLHEKSEVSSSKTSIACARRIVNMMKNPYRRHNTQLMLQDVLRDEVLKKNVQNIIEEINANIDPKDSSRCLPHMNRLVDHVFNYLFSNSVVRLSQSSTRKTETALPDSLEEFRAQYNIEYIENTKKKVDYLPFKSENDVVVTVLTCLIYSTLFSQLDKNRSINMNYLYQIFKFFKDDHLNLALSFVRSNRLISMNKYGDRLKSAMLPIGKGTYHFSATFHAIVKSFFNPKVFGMIYERYLKFLRNPELNNFEVETTDIGTNMIQIAYIVHDKIHFDIRIPENIMYFNPSAVSVVDPTLENKPVLDTLENRTQKTLSLIQDTFFKNSENAKEGDVYLIQDVVIENDDTLDDLNNSQLTSFGDKSNEDVLSDNDSDDDLAVKLDEELEKYHGKRSKLSVFVTRAQFKQSHARFSNAYDHYLINKFSILFKLDSNRPYFEVLGENINRNFFEEIEKNSAFTKHDYKLTELTNIVKRLLPTIRERDYALHFLNYLQSIGVTGATTEMITSEFKDFQLLKKVSDALIKKKLILRGGNECMRYIHIDYVHHWAVPCWKNMDAFVSEKNSKESTQSVVINRLINEKFASNNDTNQVWLAIRPWIQINGTINQSGLESLLVRVLTHVAKNPGVSLFDLQCKFEPALLPQWTRELLEILLELKIVRWYLYKIPKFTLFSKHSGCTVSDCVTGFESENVIFIEPDVNCLAKLSMIISNKKYEDLLDTKYDMNSAVGQPNEVEQQNVPQNGDNKELV
ncbi:general transcription factor 3C polypeptide 1 [Planococcus citri]|uniref:general transcription factor 3C polypeptide 1 n=1 Tax=Planococcus citri TaxID=170843 RepID=UPI0031F84950